MRTRKGERRLRAALRRLRGFLAAAIAATALVAVSASMSDAVPATGGVGNFTSDIQWISWGASGTVIPNEGMSKTETFVSGGQNFAITCTISPFIGGMAAYRPGAWQGDGLDEMYNIGGTNGSNSLVNGLRNTVTSTTITFDLTCSGTVNGNLLPLAGLVFADAEQSGSADEHIAATAPLGATWRIIDRYRNTSCLQSTQATLDANNRLMLQGDGANPQCSAGPTAVAFIDGATAVSNVTLKGGGMTAIAIGVMLGVDHGDAPSSYGDPVHVVQSSWTGGDAIVSTPTAISENAFPLATRGSSAIRLGALVDADDTNYTATATGDNTDGSNDEDGLASSPARAVVLPGESYTLPSVSCTVPNGSAAVQGWIDWNGDGTFGAAEGSGAVPCTGGLASLSWTVPGDVRTSVSPTSFLRLRIGPDAASVSQPTGLAMGGEVEDYALEIEVPAPVTTPDSGSTEQNTASAPFNPSANDAPHPVGGAALDPTSVRLMDGATPVTTLSVSGGTFTVNTTTGDVTFAPSQGFTGPAASATYRVTDANGQSATSTIAMIVTAVSPTAVADAATTSQGQFVDIDVPANDLGGNAETSVDPSSVQLTAGAGGGTPTNGGTTLVVPAEGTYEVAPTGVVTFTPDAAFVGTSSIGYSIADEDGTRSSSTIDVSVAGVAPVAVPDVALTQQNRAVTFSPAANDLPGVSGGTPIDPTSVLLLPLAGSTLSVDGRTLTTPAGTFVLGVGGDITFDPAQGYSGSVPTVGYRVSDTGGRTDESTIDVTVIAVAPQPADDAGTTDQGDPVVIPVPVNDLPGNVETPLDPGSVRLLDPGIPGSTLSVGDTILTVPGEGTYTVDAGGSGSVTFAPDPGFVGVTSAVSYRIDDLDGGTGSATITVDVIPVPPLPEPDAPSTEQNTVTTFSVLGNDSPGVPGGSALDPTSVVLMDGPTPVTTLVLAEGTFTVGSPSGRVTFTPAPGFVGGVPPVTYRVTDVNGESATSSIDVTVTAVSPTAQPDTPMTPQGVPVVFDPLGNDVAGNAATPLDPATVRLTTNGAPGATLSPDGLTLSVAGEGTYVVQAPSGEVRFAPVPAFHGVATMIGYTVDDIDGSSTASTIELSVAPTTLVAHDDIGMGTAGQPITVNPLLNDDVGAGVPLVASTVRLTLPSVPGAVLSPDARTLTVPAEGTYTVDPTTGYVTFLSLPTMSVDSTPVSYTVEDENGVVISAVLWMNVEAPTLAFTGGTPADLLGIAGLLLLAGLVLLGARAVRRA